MASVARRTCLIVGDGPLRPIARGACRLSRRVDPGSVSSVGVSDADLAAHLHACDLFVLPSVTRQETFGVVQLEAMACGQASREHRPANGRAVGESARADGAGRAAWRCRGPRGGADASLRRSRAAREVRRGRPRACRVALHRRGDDARRPRRCTKRSCADARADGALPCLLSRARRLARRSSWWPPRCVAMPRPGRPTAATRSRDAVLVTAAEHGVEARLAAGPAESAAWPQAVCEHLHRAAPAAAVVEALRQHGAAGGARRPARRRGQAAGPEGHGARLLSLSRAARAAAHRHRPAAAERGRRSRVGGVQGRARLRRAPRRTPGGWSRISSPARGPTSTASGMRSTFTGSSPTPRCLRT